MPDPTWITIYRIADLYARYVFPQKIKITEVNAVASHHKKSVNKSPAWRAAIAAPE